MPPPVLVHERQKLPAGNLTARDHCHEVSRDLLGNADVVTDELKELLVGNALRKEFHRGYAEPLLEDGPGVRREDGAAYVRRVGDDAGERGQLAVAEHRRGHREVRAVAGPHPGVVGDDHIARPPRLRGKTAQEVLHGSRQRAYQGWDRAPVLGQRVAVAVHQDACVVVAFAHYGREGRAHQRRRSLVGDRY